MWQSRTSESQQRHCKMPKMYADAEVALAVHGDWDESKTRNRRFFRARRILDLIDCHISRFSGLARVILLTKPFL